MHLGCSTAQDVVRAANDHEVQIVDVKFTDLFGQWHHFSMPIEEFDADVAFEEGMGFDGSSIRGFQSIENSDMVLRADPTTALIDPLLSYKTLSMVCNVYDPITGEAYSRDPRNVAGKAVEYLKSTGIADSVFMGPEAEFFVFDEVSYFYSRNAAGYAIDSEEGPWSSGTPGLGHKVGWKGGYFPVSPFDTMQDLRSEMVRTMIDAGLDVEVHHHEVGTAGQAEIDLKYGPMVQMADDIQLYKYIVKNVAKKNGKTATFMPKPLFEDNGSGMHTHQSLWKDGQPLFAGDGYAGLSEMALHYVGGILKHINSILAFAAPLTNSYRRLVPGYEAPVIVAISARNRSAAVRIPMYSSSPKSKRIEFRCPDPGANPYLAFSAMLMAGLDGIKNKIDPGAPAEEDLFEEENMGKYSQVKGSLSEVLDALEADNEFLLAGDVFTPDLISTYIEYKREAEVDAVRLRPHPQEFVMYYGI
jgi:glutamine synthetase